MTAYPYPTMGSYNFLIHQLNDAFRERNKALEQRNKLRVELAEANAKLRWELKQ